jgi:uncharacterized SAM-binding protein YcdF (DUF218 family)
MFFWLKKLLGYWLMPLPGCLGLLVVGAVLLRSKSRTKLGRGMLIAGIAGLLIFSNKAISAWLVRPLEARYAAIPELKADAIPRELAACRFVVVLGSGNGNLPGLSATNEMSGSGLARITEAVRLLRHLPEARLVVSGPAEGRNPAHAVVLARAAESLGVDLSRVSYIDQARDTEEESLAVKTIVGEAPFALVTTAWHMPRSMALFHHIGLTPLPCPTDYTARSAGFTAGDLAWDVESLNRSTAAVHERLGYLWIWLRGRT